jgi:hypothetical protein
VLGPEFSIQRGILALFDLVMLHGVLLAWAAWSQIQVWVTCGAGCRCWMFRAQSFLQLDVSMAVCLSPVCFLSSHFLH